MWLPLAAVALVRTFAAYHYGVLHHYCPWCLFLPEYDLVGFPVYSAWMLVALEAPAVLVLSARGLRERPSVCPLAEKGTRGAARNILLAGLVFVLLAAGPAVWWRLNFGMWLNG